MEEYEKRVKELFKRDVDILKEYAEQLTAEPTAENIQRLEEMTVFIEAIKTHIQGITGLKVAVKNTKLARFVNTAIDEDGIPMWWFNTAEKKKRRNGGMTI